MGTPANPTPVLQSYHDEKHDEKQEEFAELMGNSNQENI